MTATEREQIINLLTLRTGWHEDAFRRLDDKELQRLYDERVGR